MRKIILTLIVLLLAAFCDDGTLFCQANHARDELLLPRDAFLQNFDPIGHGMEKLEQPLLQVTPEKTHFLKEMSRLPGLDIMLKAIHQD